MKHNIEITEWFDYLNPKDHAEAKALLRDFEFEDVIIDGLHVFGLDTDGQLSACPFVGVGHHPRPYEPDRPNDGPGFELQSHWVIDGIAVTNKQIASILDSLPPEHLQIAEMYFRAQHTQEFIAKRLGVSKSKISRIINGYHHPKSHRQILGLKERILRLLTEKVL